MNGGCGKCGVVDESTPQTNANKLNYMNICFTSYLNQMVVFE